MDASSDALSSLALVVAVQCAAGAAWGVLTTVVVSAALALGGAAKVGTAAGMVFAALAAALIRLAFVYGRLNANASIVWIPVLAWLAAGALLVARARATEALLSVADVRGVRIG